MIQQHPDPLITVIYKFPPYVIQITLYLAQFDKCDKI